MGAAIKIGGVDVSVLPYTMFVTPDTDVLLVESAVDASIVVVEEDNNGAMMAILATSHSLTGVLVNIPPFSRTAWNMRNAAELDLVMPHGPAGEITVTLPIVRMKNADAE